jgi:hypothetical protein
VGTQDDGLDLDTRTQSFTDPHKHWKRRLIQTVVSVSFMVMACALLWEHHGTYVYALKPRGVPLQVGDVSESTPQVLPHNAYVQLTGITEHRALKQERVRGLSFKRGTYAYFKLLGSQGVFLEVPVDSPAYDTTMRVQVQGRVIDPHRVSGYEDVLQRYEEVFFKKHTGDVRIVQVDVKPGDHRLGALGVLGGVLFLVLWNARVLYKLWRVG